MTTPSGLPMSLLLAQAGGGAAGSGSLMPIVVQFVLIIGIIYFIMIRPQQRQKKKHEELLGALKRGDEVVTAGGIVGEVLPLANLQCESDLCFQSGELVDVCG